MSDQAYVWVSSFRRSSELILGLETDRTDGSNGSPRTGLPLARSIWVGEVPPLHQLPCRIWPGREKPRDLPPLFLVRGFIFVTQEAARILECGDLGDGSLEKVAMVASETSDEIERHVFCWVLGNTKSALDLAASRLEHVVTDAPCRPYGFLPNRPRDGDVRVDEMALWGPDVWYDPALRDGVFLGRKLGDALEAAGLARAFHIHKAPVQVPLVKV